MSKRTILVKVFLVLLLTIGIGNASVYADTNLKIDNALKSKIHTIIKNATAADSNIKKLSRDCHVALNKQHRDEATLQKARQKYPIFIITGEVRSWKPFMLWGSAFSYDASYSHIGQRTTASNILIENPDQNKVMYGQYVQGLHYFKRVTTGKGLFGQDVPIYVYGGKPSELTTLEKRVSTDKKNVQAYIIKISNYVNSKYKKKIKAKPKDETLYVEKAIVLFNLSKNVNIDFFSKATATLKVIKNPVNLGIYFLYAADGLSFDTKANAYTKIAKSQPNLVYNFPTTPDQFFMAGLALKPNYRKEAIYCFQKALHSKNSSTRSRAHSYINQLKKAQVSSIEVSATNSLLVKPGETELLIAEVYPEEADNNPITWTSSNKSIAKVDKNGNVTGISEGDVVITATVDGKSAGITITVTNNEGLSLDAFPYSVTNNLITELYLSVDCVDSATPVNIEKIEYYQQGSLVETNTSSDLAGYGFPTVIDPPGWGEIIHLKNGLLVNGSSIKLTVKTNDGIEHVYECPIQ